MKYRRELLKLVREVGAIIRNEVRPQLERVTIERDNLRPTTDAPADEIRQIILLLENRFGEVFSQARVERMVQEMVSATDDITKRELARALGGTTTLTLGPELFASSELLLAIRTNVRLIRDIERGILHDVEGTILRGVQRGLRHEEIGRDLAKRLGIAENRARLIARDQVASVNGTLTQLRQQAAGIERYIWITSLDERVRPEHEARDGEVFRWDQPPSDGHPGQPINCRCTASPILE